MGINHPKISNSQINWGHASIESQRGHSSPTRINLAHVCPTICSAFPAFSCAAVPPRARSSWPATCRRTPPNAIACCWK
ncbi:protein of unknown function [Stenotrophomonas maltophilia]|nr:protein of unknown function [Stenotrophomonas maltophilia]